MLASSLWFSSISLDVSMQASYAHAPYIYLAILVMEWLYTNIWDSFVAPADDLVKW
jgi:hypothetical protein